ncbi:hypothetical protein D3C75_923470 [compost metagenome]
MIYGPLYIELRNSVATANNKNLVIFEEEAKKVRERSPLNRIPLHEPYRLNLVQSPAPPVM